MKDKGIKIRETIIRHILNNRKEYLLVLIIFIIGIFLGVLFVNHTEEEQRAQIQTYLDGFIEKMKSTENLNVMSLIRTSIFSNSIFAIIIWFFGTTVIRDTNCFWINCLSWIWIRIYYFIMCYCFWND